MICGAICGETMDAQDRELRETAQAILRQYARIRNDTKTNAYQSQGQILDIATIFVAASHNLMPLEEPEHKVLADIGEQILSMPMSRSAMDLADIIFLKPEDSDLVSKLAKRASTELALYAMSMFDETSDLALRRGELYQALQAANDLQELLKQSREDVLVATESLRENLGEYITLKEGAAFIQRANNYATTSRVWLLGSIFLATVLTWCAGWLAWNTLWRKIPIPTSALEAYSLLGSKAAFFGLFLLGVTVCTRNYAANRHNQVVNLHRADALTSYRALVTAAGSDTHRDIILTQAATAIFSNQDSGFVKTANGGDTPTVVNTIAETIRPKAQ
jgi:hypothetical protein